MVYYYINSFLCQPVATTTKFLPGKNIHNYRKKAGLTQLDLANKTGLKQSYISRIEECRINPRRDTLRKIAKALRVDEGILTREEATVTQKDILISLVKTSLTAKQIKLFLDMAAEFASSEEKSETPDK